MKANNSGTGINQINESLENLLSKRNGGAVNFRGVHYQVLYACYALLSELVDTANTKSMIMEGIEDIDLNSKGIFTNSNQYIQIKSSINKMDAAAFWELGVLQNFAETYVINKESSFKLVYNMKIASGNLSSLIAKSSTDAVSDYWISKLKLLNYSFDFTDFIGKISFEYHNANDLYNKIQALLFNHWQVNKGTEQQFLTAIFYNILVWSKDRKSVKHNDLQVIFQQIRDSFSKSPVNDAVRYNWISKVDYISTTSATNDDYFDGKSARPIHIAAGIPVRRKSWEQKIQETFIQADVLLIKSSSGQGKSTLAWQTGYNNKEAYNVYQLNSCKSSEEAAAIVDFLETRFIIGERPLIIIDGLDQIVSSWSEVVQRTSDKPVKYIITSREEDWYRHGADLSRINLLPIDITMSINEAKDIFEQLKRKDKIHIDINEWQPSWERLNQKGLLIEYVYLLTKGQMIHDRLNEQIKHLNKLVSAAAKIEILRLTSLADCLNIRLRTTHLIDYIKKEIGFEQDRGEILKELEKEYFLRFDSEFITGLHPVRSNHLKDILHANLPIEASLINLHKIVDEDFKHDFFINATTVLTESNKQIFLEDLAKNLSNGTFSEMVFALDGLMYSEPKKYWIANRYIYDKAYNIGGIEIFTLGTVPFTKLSTLNELSNIGWDKGGSFKFLSELQSDLPTYSFENSSVVLFAKTLNKHLCTRLTRPIKYDGLEFLMRWFKILKLPYKLQSINHEVNIEDLVKMEISEAKELILYVQIVDPAYYLEFTTHNEKVLISYLKYQTNSLSILRLGNNVEINYILFDNESDRINELSVFRAETVRAFLPNFERYSTEAILLPFPSEEIISALLQSSRKSLSSEAIGDKFDQHLNAIWRTTILKNYQEDSAYTWQKNNLRVRNIAMVWAKNVIQIIDSLLEGNTAKQKSSAATIDKNCRELANALAVKKSYPNYENKYFEKAHLIAEERVIDKWFGSLGNINSQVLNIFLPKNEHDRHVALINLKAVCYDLSKMQGAFITIEAKTFKYFQSEDIYKEEKRIYDRLYSSVMYYISHLPLETKLPVRVGRIAVENWWKIEQGKLLNTLKVVLKEIAEDYGYEFVVPSSLHFTNTLTYCTFGIRNFDFSDQESFFQLSQTLAPLSRLQCDFYTIVSIKDNMAIGSLRFQKGYFEVFQKLADGGGDLTLEGLAPLPMAPDKEDIARLDGIEVPDPSELAKAKEIEFKILFDLWRLSEFRSRLDRNSEIEMNWLQESEEGYATTINSTFNSLKNTSQSLRKFVENGLSSGFIYNKNQIIEKMFECLKN